MKTSDITTLMVLEACMGFHGSVDVVTAKSGFEVLCDDFPEKVVLSAMYRDERKGYIEYGTSVRTSWVTEKGFEYMSKTANS